MGSLSDLKRQHLAKSDDTPSYYPGGKAATVTGATSALTGAVLLRSGNRLTQRTTRARRNAYAELTRRQQAALNATTSRQARAAAQGVDTARRATAYADKLKDSAPYRQKMLRTRGAVLAGAGAGLVGYGAYAKRKNRMGGYA